MSNQEIYNIGTTVYYAGDDSNQGGYGMITDQLTDYLDELQLEITLEDGRVISNVTLNEFEGQSVLGQAQSAEFQMMDTWENDLRTFAYDVGEYEEYRVFA